MPTRSTPVDRAQRVLDACVNKSGDDGVRELAARIKAEFFSTSATALRGPLETLERQLRILGISISVNLGADLRTVIKAADRVLLDSDDDSLPAFWEAIDKLAGDFELPAPAPEPEPKPAKVRGTTARDKRKPSRPPGLIGPDALTLVMSGKPEPERKPEPEQGRLAPDADPTAIRHMLLELLSQEVESARRNKQLRMTGGTVEGYTLNACALLAGIGDRAFGGTEFRDAFGRIMRSGGVEAARETGRTRLVGSNFFPCQDDCGIDLRFYEDFVANHLEAVMADEIEKVPLHPTFMWRAFSGGKPKPNYASRQIVMRFKNTLERISTFDFPPAVTCLAVTTRLSTSCNAYQLSAALQMLAGQRGITDGLLFRSGNAHRFFNAQMITQDGSQFARLPVLSGKIKAGNIGFPTAPGLAEVWGYYHLLKTSMNSLGELAF